MMLGLLVAEKNMHKHTHKQTRFMFLSIDSYAVPTYLFCYHNFHSFNIFVTRINANFPHKIKHDNKG